MSNIDYPQPAAAPGPIERALAKLSRALGRTEPAEDRRAHRRIPAHGTAKLFRIEQPDEAYELVHVIDISPTGVALRCKQPIAAGSKVLIEDNRMSVSGFVRRCTPDGSEFTLGIEVDQGDVPPDYGPKLLNA